MNEFQDDQFDNLLNETEQKPKKHHEFFRMVAILFVLGIYMIIFLKIVFLA